MGRRVDGRANEGTLRPLACELSTLHRADGSALWKSGATHVLAAVYGPLAPQIMSKEKPDEAMVTVLIKEGVPDASSMEDEWVEFLVDILSACIDRSKFPRCVVQVILHIIQGDGSILGCLIHAAVAALMDAGVDLLFLPVATTCLVVHEREQHSGNEKSLLLSSENAVVLLDPTRSEEEEVDTTILVLVNQSTEPDNLLGIRTIGPGLALDQIISCTQAATKASPAVVAFWRLAVEQKINRESQTLWSR